MWYGSCKICFVSKIIISVQSVLLQLTACTAAVYSVVYHNLFFKVLCMYTRFNKNPSARNFLNPKPEMTCGTVAIIIRVVLLSPYLRIRAVSLSSIHYNQSHRVYINTRRQYICLI